MTFYFYVGPRPSNKHYIDFVGKKTIYKPNNIRGWATKAERAARQLILDKAFSEYKKRQPPKAYMLSCAGPKCSIKFCSTHRNKKFCSEKCKAANYYFLRQFKPL